MNAIDLIKRDHDKIRRLFREWGEAGDRGAEKRDVVEQALMELEIHSKLEEEIFYPAVRGAGGELHESVEEGVTEHEQMDQIINELKAMDPSSDVFVDRFQALVGMVQYHVAEEEGDLLPKAERALGAESERLADRMIQRREQLVRDLLPSLGRMSQM